MAKRACIVALVVLMTVVSLPAQTTSWRPTIVAQHGMVAAGHPLAAKRVASVMRLSGASMRPARSRQPRCDRVLGRPARWSGRPHRPLPGRS